MNSLMIRFFCIVLLSLLAGTSSHAIDQGDMRLSVLGGNIALLGDVTSGGQNKIGFGGSFSYLVSDDMAFDIGYVSSSHTNVSHSNVTLGVDYYTGGDETNVFYVSGGIGFINNKLETPAITGSGMSLYLGGGVDFQIRKNFLFGLQFKYNKAFEATDTVAGQEIKTVQDTIMVLAKLAFVLPSETW